MTGYCFHHKGVGDIGRAFLVFQVERSNPQVSDGCDLSEPYKRYLAECEELSETLRQVPQNRKNGKIEIKEDDGLKRKRHTQEFSVQKNREWGMGHASLPCKRHQTSARTAEIS